MIESAHISGEASYSAAGQTLSGLRRINFLYGANGSGKTTISRVLAAVDQFPACSVAWTDNRPVECLVYNPDFVRQNFRSNVPGIFTLGEHDAETLAKIDKARTDLATLESDITSRKNTLNGVVGSVGKLTELADLRSAFEEECWQIKNRHDTNFMDAFTGFRNSKASFCDKLLAESASNQAELHPIDTLRERALVIFDKALQREPSVRAASVAELLPLEQAAVLGKKVIGQGDVDIAALIDRLNNSDWVKQGLSRVDKRDSHLPRVLIQDCFLRSSHGSRRLVGCGVGTDRAAAAV